MIIITIKLFLYLYAIVNMQDGKKIDRQTHLQTKQQTYNQTDIYRKTDRLVVGKPQPDRQTDR